MKTQHTPGPWIIQRDNENPLHYIVTDSRTESNIIAGPFLSENIMHPDERLARQASDAQLIAAAPDLLVALKAIVADVDKLGYSDLPPACKARAYGIIVALEPARAAIAKAGGDK